MTTTTNINHTDWSLYDDQGYLQQHGVDVHDLDDGTIRIGRTLHNATDLRLSEDRIESNLAGWYLTR